MKLKLAFIMFIGSMLVGCSEFSGGNSDHIDTPYKTMNLENVTSSDNGYIVDKRSGCLYFASANHEIQVLNQINGEAGVQVGCEYSNTSVNRYFNED